MISGSRNRKAKSPKNTNLSRESNPKKLSRNTKKQEEDQKVRRGELIPSNLFQSLTFSHLNKIIDAGNKAPYSEDMLFGVDKAFKFEAPHARFEAILDSQISRKLSFATLLKYSLPFMAKLSTLCFLSTILSVLTAFYTSKLIDWLQDEEPYLSEGGPLTLLAVFLIILKVFGYNWYNKTF